MAIPKPRREGQSGGMNHRSSNTGFRRSGGHVKPPSKGCAVLVIAMVAAPVAAVWAGVGVFL